ncbi:MAG: ABC transporter substrate-binding protein [Thermodesulfobacteriota bacterium]|nr:ABC transporter substrate-binding protein [Thermodesulfobacteriota bacterium]
MAVSIRQMKQVVVFSVIFLLAIIPAAHAGKESGKTIKLGIIGPMTFVAGEGTLRGATMAVEEINSAGGVQVGKEKFKLEIIKADDNCLRSVSDAVSAMERLITYNKVDFVVGGYHSESVFAQQDVIADHKKIFIDTGSASPKQPGRLAKDFDRFRYYFRIHADSIQAAKTILATTAMVANRIKKEIGIEKPRVALLMEKLMWVDPIVPFCQAKLPKMGMEVVGVWRPSSVATDLTAEWTAIKAAKTHMVLEISSGPAGTIGPRQWGELQIPAALLGNNIPAMGRDHWEATNKKCNYQLTCSSYGPVEVTPKTMPYYRAFDKRFGGIPVFNENSTYDGVFVLKDAIERAGTIETEAVLKALEKTDFIGVLGRLVFEQKGSKTPHNIIRGPGYYTMVALQWRDGKQVVVWPDGKAQLGDPKWVGVRYGGTKDYVLPPWVVEYWKGK